jgi:hypothetical protein
MLNSGKIIRAVRDQKKNILTCVVRKKNSERNKKPYPPCRLNGRSLSILHFNIHTPYNRLSGQQMLSGAQIISTSHGMTTGTRIPDPLFPHLVPPAIMVWIFVWKYIFEPFIHILQHFVLQLSFY